MKKLLLTMLLSLITIVPCFALTFPIDNEYLNIKNGHVWLSGYFFEYRSYGQHQAIDIPCPVGTPIRAPEAGRIIEKGFEYRIPKGPDRQAYGNYVIILTNSGDMWLLAHLNSYDVRLNDYVSEGQVIAESGWTGLSEKRPHLHLEKRNSKNKKVFFTQDFGIKFRLKR